MDERVVRNDALAQQEKKVVKKVVNGPVKTKKKNEIHKLTDVFITEDVDNVKTYIVSELVIPTIKNTIVDIITNSINMLFFGETSSSKKRSPSSKVSYQRFYDKKDDRVNSQRYLPARAGYYYDDIILESRGEVEEVIDSLNELIDVYGVASVADLNEMIGVTGQYTDNRYGWTNLRKASFARCRDGYELRLPKAMPID